MAIKRRNKINAEFSMSSLTDIIFLLLIFFMLTSTLVTQNALNLKLPSSASKTVAPQSMSVSIQKGARYYLNGRRTSLQNIENEIRRVLPSIQDKKTSVLILSEQGVPIEDVVAVMDIAARLKIDANLATEPVKR
jgi:biopolymer transport protein ExbD